jgi:hypothetical protein
VPLVGTEWQLASFPQSGGNHEQSLFTVTPHWSSIAKDDSQHTPAVVTSRYGMPIEPRNVKGLQR